MSVHRKGMKSPPPQRCSDGRLAEVKEAFSQHPLMVSVAIKTSEADRGRDRARASVGRQQTCYSLMCLPLTSYGSRVKQRLEDACMLADSGLCAQILCDSPAEGIHHTPICYPCSPPPNRAGSWRWPRDLHFPSLSHPTYHKRLSSGRSLTPSCPVA